jgi:hypothetical protein
MCTCSIPCVRFASSRLLLLGAILLLPWILACQSPAAGPLAPEAEQRILNQQHHHLSFDYDINSLSLSNEKATTEFLEQTDILFVLDGVPLGRGEAGLQRLRAILPRLPAKTVILADHYLMCGKNRWSLRVIALGKEAEAQSGTRIQCDGAF